MFRFLLLLSILAIVFGNGRVYETTVSMIGDTPVRQSSPFWPQPQAYSIGSASLDLSNSFRFSQSQSNKSALLDRALNRYQAIYSGYLEKSKKKDHNAKNNQIKSCSIQVDTILSDPKTEKDSLALGVDESYTIDISTSGECNITAATVWGALHALETFTQLLERNTQAREGQITMNYAPVSVQNSARFTHRGILIDSARHFLPTQTIKRMIDTLPMSHFNVLHWHMVDAQSFPLNTPSSPEMYKGAFTPEQVYSMDEVTDIDTYATDRGVRIVYELDGPGHTASWGKGYPEILADCIQKYSYNVNDLAMNPTLDKTYEVLTGVLKDIVAATGTKFLHLGGDEVVYGCWAEDASITAYMKENNIATYPELLGLYVQQAEDISRNLGATPIQWEDTFMAGIRPPLSTIFDVWTNSSNMALVASAGYRVIAAPQNYWYLDHCANTWQNMYSFDPQAGMNAQQSPLIIGGEVSMWGEMINQYNIEPRIWPFAAAVGERLWSSMNNTAVSNIADAQLRLNTFACRMNARGYAAAPINPGYCQAQYV